MLSEAVYTYFNSIFGLNLKIFENLQQPILGILIGSNMKIGIGLSGLFIKYSNTVSVNML